MRRSSVTDQFLRTVGTFALLGPLVGVGVVWIGLIGLITLAGYDTRGSGVSLSDYLTGVPAAILLTLIAGYVVGILPAAATGIICHLFARSVHSDALWLVASAAVGAASGVAAAAIASGGGPDRFSLGLLAIPGAVAAAACALKLRRERWT